MVKKISCIIVAIAILAAGTYEFIRLDYWERSTGIFSMNTREQSFEGRRGEGRGDFDRSEGFREDSERHEMHELNDSKGACFHAGERNMRSRDGNMSDSLLQQFRAEGGLMGNGHDRDEFTGGKRIYLRNVIAFLGVFASFALLVIYLDKIFYLTRKRKSRSNNNQYCHPLVDP